MESSKAHTKHAKNAPTFTYCFHLSHLKKEINIIIENNQQQYHQS